MQLFPYMLATLVVGIVISLQPPMNGMLARAVGSAYGAATISIGIAFISILLLIFFMGPGEISRRTLGTVPWWIYLSGTIGAVFVAAGAAISPVTGTLVFFVCIVAGQLIGSILMDHFGAFGLEVRTISPTRVLGLLLVLSGAFLVSWT
jgi:transporter family-2 protein